MIPGLAMLRGYRRAWLRGDLLAGVTVAAYLVPQVMAYADGRGAAAGRRAVGGLPGADRLRAARLVAAAVHGSGGDDRADDRVAIKPLAAGDPARYAKLAATLALLVGLMRWRPGCCDWDSSRTCCRGRSWSATWRAWP